MASGSIGHVPAPTFAEYVDDPFFDQSRHEVGPSQAPDQEGGDFDRGAPSTPVSQWELAHPSAPPSRCIAVRPALTHRLYSHHLHVRAKAKLQRDRLLSGPMIDIYVGESKRHWALHRNLLCHHSEALENELLGDGKGSARKDRLDLPDYDPAGFELLVKWLYQGSLDDVSDMVDANQKYDYAVSCHKLYLLCERFEMAQLKNVAMDQYRKGLNEAELVPDAEEIDDIYRKSPKGSPFRRLMTRIAARQIMDPANERDVETYRECFDNNPDFAIDLVKAIRSGTGGMLFEDPTDKGNECAYHDHKAGPNCYTKGKLKGKQAKKRAGPSSAKSVPFISSDQQSRPPRPHPPMNPRPLPPPSARPPERNILHRRLTSPASSTVGTSTEMAVATQPPNPDAVRHREKDREKLRKVTPPEKRRLERAQANGTEKQESCPVPDECHRSSEDAPHPLKDSQAVDELEGEGEGGPVQALQTSPSRRGIWGWAKVGTGRLNMIGRMPHPEWTGPAALREMMVNGASQIVTIPETQDDFGLPSTTATETNDLQKHENVLASKIEGYGLFNAPVTSSSSFAQTKRSSDELVAASSTASTPADLHLITGQWTNGKFHMPQVVSKHGSPITPDTPTPLQRRRDTLVEIRGSPTDDTPDGESRDGDESPSNGKLTDFTASASNTPDPNQVRKYRIALAPNLLSPARSSLHSTK
ncbi:btb poz-like protein [Stemphylium lycopersici]|uniref:Btb poz-like protein n=1 Tax=Stemphylium lycopersici TaxID=183478 RepID=A0A364MSW4_STELY|nr:btb poz-like protein [Stemphylium lycopersici]